MTLKIDYRTDDRAIEGATKLELASAIVKANGREEGRVRKLKKDELLEVAKQYRDRLRKVHEEEQAVAENKRLARVEREKDDPVIRAALESLLRGFQKELNRQEETVKGFKDKVATSESFDILWKCGSRIESMMFACAVGSELAATCNALRTQLDERSRTIEQIRSWFTQSADKYTRACLNDDAFRHNSTCPIRCTENLQKAAANQFFARLYGSAVEALDKDLARTVDDLEAGVGYGEYISSSRGL